MSNFVKNSLWTILTQSAIFLVGIGNSVIIARVLQPEGRGVYALVAFFPAMLMYFCNVGIGFSTVYYIANRKYYPGVVFGNGILFASMHSVVALVIGISSVYFFSASLFSGVDSQFLFMALILAPGQIFLSFLALVLLGLQDIRDYNFFQLAKPVLGLLLVAVFLIALDLGVYGVLLSEILATYTLCAFLFVKIIARVGKPTYKLDVSYAKAAYSYGVKSYMGSVLFFLNNRLNVVFLNFFLNPYSVGVFALSSGVVERLWLVPDAIGTNLFPKISAEKDTGRIRDFTPVVFKATMLIVFVMAVLLWGAADILVRLLYSDAFVDSVAPLKIMLYGVIFYGGWRILENDLRGRGEVNLLLFPIALSFAASVLLNLVLIPRYGVIGAAWASAIASFVTLATGLLCYCKVSGNSVLSLLFIGFADIKFYRQRLSLLFRPSTGIVG